MRLTEENKKLEKKFREAMEALKESFSFMEKMGEEFKEVENETQNLKDAKELYTHIYRIMHTSD